MNPDNRIGAHRDGIVHGYIDRTDKSGVRLSRNMAEALSLFSVLGYASEKMFANPFLKKLALFLGFGTVVAACAPVSEQPSSVVQTSFPTVAPELTPGHMQQTELPIIGVETNLDKIFGQDVALLHVPVCAESDANVCFVPASARSGDKLVMGMMGTIPMMAADGKTVMMAGLELGTSVAEDVDGNGVGDKAHFEGAIKVVDFIKTPWVSKGSEDALLAVRDAAMASGNDVSVSYDIAGGHYKVTLSSGSGEGSKSWTQEGKLGELGAKNMDLPKGSKIADVHHGEGFGSASGGLELAIVPDNWVKLEGQGFELDVAPEVVRWDASIKGLGEVNMLSPDLENGVPTGSLHLVVAGKDIPGIRVDREGYATIRIKDEVFVFDFDNGLQIDGEVVNVVLRNGARWKYEGGVWSMVSSGEIENGAGAVLTETVATSTVNDGENIEPAGTPEVITKEAGYSMSVLDSSGVDWKAEGWVVAPDGSVKDKAGVVLATPKMIEQLKEVRLVWDWQTAREQILMQFETKPWPNESKYMKDGIAYLNTIGSDAEAIEFNRKMKVNYVNSFRIPTSESTEENPQYVWGGWLSGSEANADDGYIAGYDKDGENVIEIFVSNWDYVQEKATRSKN